MLNMFEVIETNNMIEHEKLDVRTITMGISLLDCCDDDLQALNEKIYKKITIYAKNLVSTGEEIARDFGVPIVNKRISVTPIALVGGCACKKPEDFVTIARTLDWRKLYRRLFCPGFQGHDSGRGEPDPLHPAGAGRDRACLQLHQCGFHQDRPEYGCSPPDG